jgi:hypothetical protein
MVVEKASGRVPGRAPGSSRSHFDDGGGLQYVSRKSDLSLRFFPSRKYIGEREASGGGPGGLTTWWRGWPLPSPLCLIFGLCEALVKIIGLAFVLSNSKNISCVAFLKHKNSKK